ncbi:MAG: VOC family protein [Clostridium sp.]|nr:VOC family protein [Clostridium sp.]
MPDGLKMKMYAVVLDCYEPKELAEFYAELLNWEVVFSDDEYTVVAPPGTAPGEYPGITFQKNTAYRPPVWPTKPDAQQQMTHLDFAVNDLAKAVEHADSCGAKVADAQFSDSWRVMLDPSGHPFCLCLTNSLFK